MVTEDHQMKFCGYEIAKVKDGFFLHQCGYLKDVLKRHGMEAGMAPVKNLFANLGEDDTEEVQTGDLRQAQQVIGELQWLVTRTRPDVVIMLVLWHVLPIDEHDMWSSLEMSY